MKPKEVATILKRNGFIERPQKSGTSHRKFYNPDTNKTTIVPFHSRDLTKDTLAFIIKQSGIAKEDFR